MNPFTNIKSKLLNIEATPQMVSRGYALGVFLGTTPFIGTKVFIALGLTTFFQVEPTCFSYRSLPHQYTDSPILLWNSLWYGEMDHRF